MGRAESADDHLRLLSLSLGHDRTRIILVVGAGLLVALLVVLGLSMLFALSLVASVPTTYWRLIVTIVLVAVAVFAAWLLSTSIGMMVLLSVTG